MKIFTDKFIAQSRFNICKMCEYFIPITSQCTKCGCFMKLKVKLNNTVCPLNKW